MGKERKERGDRKCVRRKGKMEDGKRDREREGGR